MTISTIGARSTQGRFLSLEKNWDNKTPHEKFDDLDKFYSNNSLYDALASYARDNDYWLEAIKPLRNPTNRSVEFFASKLLMGTPKITVTNGNEQTLASIQQFLKWSGFDINKRKQIRKDALYGNLFKKVTFENNKVFETILNAKYVTSFVEDERGFITEFRMDIPIENNKTYTEYWTQNNGFDGYVATWEYYGGSEMKLDQLGNPTSFAFLESFGIDFVPIVHVKFKDVGEDWGVSCIDHAVEKINEVDRKMTNLSELMFQNKAFFIVRTGLDENGIAVPVAGFSNPTDAQATQMGNFRYFPIPGAEEAQFSVPEFAWADFLAIVKSDEEELQQDLPELRYYTIRENELSGIAMRTLLAGALDRAKEAEENLITGQTRATMMGLTMGKFYGLFPASIGDFDNGDFEHTMDFEEIVPVSADSEKATTLQTLNNVLGRENLPLAMKLAGYSEEVIAQVVIPEPVVPPTNVPQDMNRLANRMMNQ